MSDPTAPNPNLPRVPAPGDTLTEPTAGDKRRVQIRQRTRAQVAQQKRDFAADRWAKTTPLEPANSWMEDVGRVTQDRTAGLGIDRDVLRRSPKLMQHMVEDVPAGQEDPKGFFGRMVQRADDMATLHQISLVADKWYSGKITAQDARAQVAQLRTGLSNMGWMDVDKRYKQLQQQIHGEPKNVLGNLQLAFKMAPTIFEAVLGDTVGLAAQQMPGVSGGLLATGVLAATVVGGGAVAGGSRGALLAGRALYQGGRGLTALGKSATAAAFSAGYLGELSRLERSLAYLDMKETPMTLPDGSTVEVPDGVARATAAGVGLVNASIDLAQLAVGASIVGGIGGAAATRGLKAAANRAVTKLIGSGSLRGIGLKHALRWAGAGTTETALEVTQEIMATVGSHTATEYTRMTTGAERADGLDLLDDAMAKAQETVRVAPAMFLMAAIPGSVGYISEAGRTREIKRGGDQLFTAIRGSDVVEIEKVTVPDDALAMTDEGRNRVLASDAIDAAVAGQLLPPIRVRMDSDGNYVVEGAADQAMVRLMQNNGLAKLIRVQDVDKPPVEDGDQVDEDGNQVLQPWVTQGRQRLIEEQELAFTELRGTMAENVTDEQVQGTVALLTLRAQQRNISLTELMKEVTWRDPDTIDARDLRGGQDGQTGAQANAQEIGRRLVDAESPDAEVGRQEGDAQAQEVLDVAGAGTEEVGAGEVDRPSLIRRWESSYHGHQNVINSAEWSRNDAMLHVMQQEGFVSEPEEDVTGVLTWGFGDTRDPEGMPQRVTMAEAVDTIVEDYDAHETAAVEAIGEDAWELMDARQRAAVTSTVYNMGSGTRGAGGLAYQYGDQTADTTLAALMAGNVKGNVSDTRLIDEWVTYSKAGGKYWPGLVNRRGRDMAVFFGPERLPQIIEAMQAEHAQEINRIRSKISRTEDDYQRRIEAIPDDAALQAALRAELAELIAPLQREITDKEPDLMLPEFEPRAEPVDELLPTAIAEPGVDLDPLVAQMEGLISGEITPAEARVSEEWTARRLELEREAIRLAEEQAQAEAAVAERRGAVAAAETEAAEANAERRRAAEQARLDQVVFEREQAEAEIAAIRQQAEGLEAISAQNELVARAEAAERQASALEAERQTAEQNARIAQERLEAAQQAEADQAEQDQREEAAAAAKARSDALAVRNKQRQASAERLRRLEEAQQEERASEEAEARRQLDTLQAQADEIETDVDEKRADIEAAEEPDAEAQAELDNLEARRAEQVDEMATAMAEAQAAMAEVSRKQEQEIYRALAAEERQRREAAAEEEAITRQAERDASARRRMARAEIALDREPELQPLRLPIDTTAEGVGAPLPEGAAPGVTMPRRGLPVLSPDLAPPTGVEGVFAAGAAREQQKLAMVQALVDRDVPAAMAQATIDAGVEAVPAPVPAGAELPAPGLPARELPTVAEEGLAAPAGGEAIAADQRREQQIAAMVQRLIDRGIPAARARSLIDQTVEAVPAPVPAGAELPAPGMPRRPLPAPSPDRLPAPTGAEAALIADAAREQQKLAMVQALVDRGIPAARARSLIDQTVEAVPAPVPAGAELPAPGMPRRPLPAPSPDRLPAPTGAEAALIADAAREQQKLAMVQALVDRDIPAARARSLIDQTVEAVPAPVPAGAELPAPGMPRRGLPVPAPEGLPAPGGVEGVFAAGAAREQQKLAMVQALVDRDIPGAAAQAAIDAGVEAVAAPVPAGAELPAPGLPARELPTVAEEGLPAPAGAEGALEADAARERQIAAMVQALVDREIPRATAQAAIDEAVAAVPAPVPAGAELPAPGIPSRPLPTPAAEGIAAPGRPGVPPPQPRRADQVDIAEPPAPRTDFTTADLNAQLPVLEPGAKGSGWVLPEVPEAGQLPPPGIPSRALPAPGAVGLPSPVNLRPSTITFDPAVLGERGIKLGGKATNATVTEPVTLWEDNEGELHVVGGEGRVSVARDIRETNPEQPMAMEAEVLRESDGVTRDMAKKWATEGRKQDSQQKVMSTAGWLRLTPGAPEWFRGLPNRGKARRAVIGASALSDTAWNMLQNQPAKFSGWVVGDMAPNRPEEHAPIIAELQNGIGTVEAAAHTRFRLSGQPLAEARTRADVIAQMWDELFSTTAATAPANRLHEKAQEIVASHPPLMQVAENNKWQREDVLQAAMHLWIGAAPMEVITGVTPKRLAKGLARAASTGALDPGKQDDLNEHFRVLEPGDRVQIGSSWYHLIEPELQTRSLRPGRGPVKAYREDKHDKDVALRYAAHQARKTKERVWVMPQEDFGEQVWVVQPESQRGEKFGDVGIGEYVTPLGDVYRGRLSVLTERTSAQQARRGPGPAPAPVTDEVARAGQAAAAAVQKLPEEVAAVQQKKAEQASRVMQLEHKREAVPAADVQIDPMRFQFKKSDKRGRTGRLVAGPGEIERWDALAGQGLVLWQDTSGTYFVADGHQRANLAKELEATGHPPIMLDAMVLEESDGVTPEEAKVWAARVNVAQESADPVDAAAVMRTLNATDLEQWLKSFGRNATMRQGLALTQLTDDTFRLYQEHWWNAEKPLPAAIAAAVTEAIPMTHPRAGMMQQTIMDQLMRNRPGVSSIGEKSAEQRKTERQSELATGEEGRMQALQVARDLQETMVDIPDEQLAMFEDFTAQHALFERAKIITRVLRSRKHTAALLKTMAKHADTLEGVEGNVVAQAESAAEADKQKLLATYLERFANETGTPIASTANRLAREVKTGEKEIAKAADELAGTVAEFIATQAQQDAPTGVGADGQAELLATEAPGAGPGPEPDRTGEAGAGRGTGAGLPAAGAARPAGRDTDGGDGSVAAEPAPEPDEPAPGSAEQPPVQADVYREGEEWFYRAPDTEPVGPYPTPRDARTAAKGAGFEVEEDTETMSLFQSIDTGGDAITKMNADLVENAGEIDEGDVRSRRLILTDGRAINAAAADADGVVDAADALDVDPRARRITGENRIRDDQIDALLRLQEEIDENPQVSATRRGGDSWDLVTKRDGRVLDTFKTDGKLSRDTMQAHYGIPVAWRGRTRFRDGRQPEITISRTGNFDTIVEELAHVWRRELSPQQEAIAAQWAGAGRRGKEFRWDRGAEERFANGFVDWMREVYVPPDAMRSLFGKFRNWLRAARNTVRRQVSPQMAKVFEDMLVSAQSPALAAYDRNRAAMGEGTAADFRDPTGRRMRINQVDAQTWRVMGHEPTDRKWTTAGDYPTRDDALRDVSGVMDGNVMAPLGSSRMQHDTIAPARARVDTKVSLSEQEKAVREVANELPLSVLFQDDDAVPDLPDLPDAPRVSRTINTMAEAAYRRGTVAERRRALLRDARRYLRARVATMQKEMMRYVDRSGTLPDAFRSPLREMARILDITRRGTVDLDRTGIPKGTDPIGMMAKIIAEQEAALNQVVGLTPEDVSTMTREQLADAQGPVIDGASSLMRDVPQGATFATLKLSDLEKLHNTVGNAVHLIRRLQQLELQNEQGLAQKRRETMMAEAGASGRQYKPRFGAMQWFVDATVGIGVQKPEILFANLGNGRQSEWYDFWRRTKNARVTERGTLQKWEHDESIDLRNAGYEFKHKYAMEAWLNQRMEVAKINSLPANKRWTRAELMSLYYLWKQPYSRERMTAAGGGVVLYDHRTHNAVGTPYRLAEEEMDTILAPVAVDAEKWEPVMRKRFEVMFAEMSRVHTEQHGYEPESAGPHYFPLSAVPQGKPEDPATGGSMSWMAFDGRKPEASGPGVFKGMLEERTGVTVPIQVLPLNMVLARAGNHAAAYVGMEPVMREWRLALNDGSVERSVENHWGKPLRNIIREHLRQLAHEHRQIEDWVQAGDKIRQNVSVATLASPRIALMQSFSYTLFGAHIPGRYIMGSWIRARKPSSKRAMQERHRMFDPDFVERTGQGFDPDARSTSGASLLPPSRSAVARNKERAINTMMGMLRFVDVDTVTAGEDAAVRYGLDILDGTVPWDPKFGDALGLTQQEARSIPPEGTGRVEASYRWARWVVEKTQPSFLTENLSHMQRHPVGKWFMVFTGYRNVAWNALMEAVQDYRKNPGPVTRRSLAYVTGTILIGAMGAELMRWLEKQLQGRETGPLGGSIAWAGASAAIGLTPFSGLIYAHQKMGGEGAFDVPMATALTNMNKAANAFVGAVANNDPERAMKQIERVTAEGLKLYPGIPYWHARYWLTAPWSHND